MAADDASGLLDSWLPESAEAGTSVDDDENCEDAERLDTSGVAAAEDVTSAGAGAVLPAGEPGLGAASMVACGVEES